MKRLYEGWRARLMQRVSNIVYRYYWIVLICMVLLSVFAYFSATHLKLKLNFVDMLAEDDSAVVHYKDAVERFGALSYLFVVIESDDLDRSKEYADALAKELVKNPDYVPRVFHKIEAEDYMEYALLYLEPEQIKLLADMTQRNREPINKLVSDPGLTASLEGVNSMLSSYIQSGEVPELSESGADYGLVFDLLCRVVDTGEDYVVSGPGGQTEKLKDAFLEKLLKGEDKELPVDLSEPYFVSDNGKRLLMLVSSTEPAENFEWCAEYMQYVEGAVDSLKSEFPNVPDPKMTGNAAIMRDDNRVIRRDMKFTTGLAFFGIMILFAFAFRNLSSILMVGVPLGLGILWSVGAAFWTVGYLTPVTAIFGAVLLGLGIDYAILILSRYTEERHAGHSIKESLDLTLTQTGVGILTGAIATALAFFSLIYATFRAGQEMGIVAGTGIILFVIMMTFGLGSLLVAWDRAKESIGPTQKRFDPRIMRGFAKVIHRGALYLVAGLTIIIILLALRVPDYKFEYNYLNLEPQNVESIQLVHKIPEWFGIDTNYGMIISHSIKEDRKLAAELRKKDTVSRVDAISDFIPQNQPEKLEQINRIEQALQGVSPPEKTLPEKPEDAPEMNEEEYREFMEALKSLRDIVGAPGRGLVGIFYIAGMGEAEDGARKLHKKLKELIATLEETDRDKVKKRLGRLDYELRQELIENWDRVEEMVSAHEVTVESLSANHPELIDRFQGDRGNFLIYAYPSVVIWEEQNLKAVVGDLQDVDPDAMGVAVLFERILAQIKEDLLHVSLIALSLVFIVIFVNYRGLWHTLLTLVPLGCGAIAMVGIMNTVGLKFNIVNVAMLPLIIGIGVDYGVYMVHRWIGEGKGEKSIKPVVESTGRAVTLSAFTTMIGFASIIPAQWRGLSLMGSTLTMGICLCWIAAVLYLPSILKVIEMIKARNGRSE